jgi:hypothetical protein
MKGKNVFLLVLLVMVLVAGITVSGCASYMEWYYSTLPGGKEQHDRQLAEINERNREQDQQRQREREQQRQQQRESSSGSNSSSSSGSTPVAQQPSNTNETITRTYTFNVSTSGQAGAGAAAVAKSQAEADAAERFRRENPGYEIRNIQSQADGLGTLTVTITGRKI